jgi:dihydroorotate dehydrogenase electron transfer subunit
VKVKVMIEADPVAPPSATQRMVPVLENVRIARDTYRLRLGDPLMARAILPGQFVMIRPGPAGAEDPLLGRPFALYDVVRDRLDSPIAIDVVYLVVGRGTAALAQRRAGERVSVWGPLGNGFGMPPAGPVIFVAGGIGQTPFLALGRWWLGQLGYGNSPGTIVPVGFVPGSASIVSAPCASATLLYGVRTAALLAGLEDFRGAGVEVEIATDDGSAGHHGYVTDLLAHRLNRGERPGLIVGCGPSPMLAAVARIAEGHRVPCLVSLENHMACGFGACFSCVAPIRNGTGISDLRRVCVEGPVFAAESVDWTMMSH